ncbi:MAG: HEAT repeat domain-containing protein [Candidatus Eremiobacteraeota bacterium]|nr:HEAT repeat domain-containing protein [Candidatus Eremiobacteraeota bacterium]
MLTVQIPMLLALLGTALMAVVIFAPSRVPVPVATSFAPPAPPPFEQWEPCRFEQWEPPAIDEAVAVAQPAVGTAAWPALVDARASGCDATVRLGLVEALGAVRTPWAETILRHALDDEPDPTVRDAVAAALEGVAV